MDNDASVRFLYSTAVGRMALKLIMKLHLDHIAIRFLRSPLSHSYMARYARQHGVALTDEQLLDYRTFHDYFSRWNPDVSIDRNPSHVISPCDGFISIYKTTREGTLSIKGSHYRLIDLVPDQSTAKSFEGGLCLVFRLCASDYHRYVYIDDGYQYANHFIEGQLHSVQPIACETYPVFALNRRSWCLMETTHFGPVVQIEIGALVVGGIVNHKENALFKKGEEKGRFELAGSTIVLLFKPGHIALLDEYAVTLNTGKETRVKLGMPIANTDI